MNNIFLTGLPCAGKSSVGKSLAKLLNYKFVDLDKVIEKSEGCSIDEIFEGAGEKYFRKVEQLAFLKLATNAKQVVATGGGTLCNLLTLEVAQENDTIVYLKVSPEVAAERQLLDYIRPVLRKSDAKEGLTKQLSELLLERRKFYQRAHITVNAEEMQPEEVAEIIQQKLLST